METLALAVGVLYLVWIGYRIIARLSPLYTGIPTVSAPAGEGGSKKLTSLPPKDIQTGDPIANKKQPGDGTDIPPPGCFITPLEKTRPSGTAHR